MSKKFTIDETSIFGQYGIDVHSKYSMVVSPTQVKGVYEVMMHAIACMVKNNCRGRDTTAFIIKDADNNFKIGAILNKIKPEEGSEDDCGNFFLEFSLNEEDFKDVSDTDTFTNHDSSFTSACVDLFFKIMGVALKDNTHATILFSTAVDTLVNFLDVNAIEGEDVEVEFPSLFIASVSVENGEKVMSIVPSATIKQIVKDDTSISK